MMLNLQVKESDLKLLEILLKYEIEDRIHDDMFCNDEDIEEGVVDPLRLYWRIKTMLRKN